MIQLQSNRMYIIRKVRHLYKFILEYIFDIGFNFVGSWYCGYHHKFILGFKTFQRFTEN